MNSKILVVVLLAYFLDNYPAASVSPVKFSTLNVKNTPAYNKNTLVFNQDQPIQSHGNKNLQGLDIDDKDDDYVHEYEEEQVEEKEEEEEEDGNEEDVENNKIMTNQPISSSTSKPIVPESVNQENENLQLNLDDKDEDYIHKYEEEPVEEKEEEDGEERGDEENVENNKIMTNQPMIISSTSKPIIPGSVNQGNENLQGLDIDDKDDDYIHKYEEEEEEEEEEDGEERGDEENVENNKIMTNQPMIISSTSKPIIPGSVNQGNENLQGLDIDDKDDDYIHKYEEELVEEKEEEDGEKRGDEENVENNKIMTNQPMISSSTSKPIIPGSANQGNENLQGLDIDDKDDDYIHKYEEEEEEEDGEERGDEENLENNKIMTNQPMISSSTSKPIIPGSVNQENENLQGLDIDDKDNDYVYEYEEDTVEEKEEDRDGEEGDEDVENNKIMANQPMIRFSTSKPIVPESVDQENYSHQEFETFEEEVEDGQNVKEYLEDPNYITSTDKIMNNPIPYILQSSEDELIENEYDASDYSLNDGHQKLQSYESCKKSSNNPTEIFETLDKKNDDNKDQLINTNEFELNSYDDTQISTEKQDENTEDQYVSENNERTIYGYNIIKKILYMLHDYGSLIFNFIINKINYQMEQISS